MAIMLPSKNFSSTQAVKNHYWLNGLYEALCVIVVFPLIVALGAGGKLSGNLFSKGCDFMGKISYPLYIVHYPVIYLYWNWVTPRHLPWTSGLLEAREFLYQQSRLNNLEEN